MAILILGNGGGGTGTDVSDTTAVATDVLPGKYFYLADGTRVEGTMTTKAAATIVPSTSDQTINANQYLSGAQTIQGDSDLLAGNIKNNISIFSVTGTYKPRIFTAQKTGAATLSISHSSSVYTNAVIYAVFVQPQADTINSNNSIIECSRISSTAIAQGDGLWGTYLNTATGLPVTGLFLASLSTLSIGSGSLSMVITPVGSYVFDNSATYLVTIIYAS